MPQLKGDGTVGPLGGFHKVRFFAGRNRAIQIPDCEVKRILRQFTLRRRPKRINDLQRLAEEEISNKTLRD